MIYDIILTKPAYKDLLRYVSENLESPNTAHSLMSDINKALLSLSEFPERYPIVDIEPWKSKNMRKMPVKSYIVLYYVKKDMHKVEIARIFYGKRNIEIELNN